MYDKKLGGNRDHPPRRLRSRHKRARYIEQIADEDEDVFEGRNFNVEEKLTSKAFDDCQRNCVIELNGSDVTLEYFQRNGFETPMLVKKNENNALGMRIPPQSFTVDDVKSCVGSRRILDVMNVDTQKDDTMTMKEWCNYYNSVERHQLLNVISLEFSHTKLEAHVDSPKIVKQMDWIDLVWPRHLKRMQKEGTNALHEMKYPKVQKYCLMSVKGCYTDFHIDFGGTSVWYHILKGGKIFWLIPPTETNIQLYEKWTLSGKQSDIFFGDTVEHCCRVKLISGNTFFIPTGWIHAVYTLEDSLVFGGNFLHSFGIEKQLRVAQVEDITKVPYKFRYPFFTEVLWYVLVRYVHCLMGKNHLSVNDDGESLLKSSAKNNDVHRKSVQPSDEEDKDSNQTIINEEEEETDESKENLALQPIQSFHSFTPSLKIHLTPFEISGLKSIVNWLTQLPPSKRFVPDLLLSAENLLNDVKTLIDDHQHDDHNLAITNRPVLFWLNKKILAKINSQAKKLQARNQNLNKNSVASNYPKPTFLGSIKRNNSSSSNQYQVKLGTTLSNDLIANSLKGLIEQTGLKSGLDSTPSESPFNKLPRSMSSEPTKNAHETSESNCKTMNAFIPPVYSDSVKVESSRIISMNQSASIRTEHNYNQHPSNYFNPYQPHNYAYYPYQRPVENGHGADHHYINGSEHNYTKVHTNQLSYSVGSSLQPINQTKIIYANNQLNVSNLSYPENIGQQSSLTIKSEPASVVVHQANNTFPDGHLQSSVYSQLNYPPATSAPAPTQIAVMNQQPYNVIANQSWNHQQPQHMVPQYYQQTQALNQSQPFVRVGPIINYPSVQYSSVITPISSSSPQTIHANINPKIVNYNYSQNSIYGSNHPNQNVVYHYNSIKPGEQQTSQASHPSTVQFNLYSVQQQQQLPVIQKQTPTVMALIPPASNAKQISQPSTAQIYGNPSSHSQFHHHIPDNHYLLPQTSTTSNQYSGHKIHSSQSSVIQVVQSMNNLSSSYSNYAISSQSNNQYGR